MLGLECILIRNYLYQQWRGRDNAIHYCVKIGRRINVSGIRIVVKSTVAIPLSKAIISLSRRERALSSMTMACLYKDDCKLHSIHRGKNYLPALAVAQTAM